MQLRAEECKMLVGPLFVEINCLLDGRSFAGPDSEECWTPAGIMKRYALYKKLGGRQDEDLDARIAALCAEANA